MNGFNWGIYIVGRQVIIPTVGRTEAGLYLDIEPVAVVSLDDTEGLIQNILAMVQQGNPRVPAPQRGMFPKPVVLKYTKAKSWAAFERAAVCWSISLADGEFRIGPFARAADKGWEEDPDLMHRIADSAPLESVVQRLVGLMQSGSVRD